MKAKLKCQFESCRKVVLYESFRAHVDSCPENPANNVKCEICSQEFHQNQIASHMCVLTFFNNFKTIVQFQNTYDRPGPRHQVFNFVG